jgi:hypothetical protein
MEETSSVRLRWVTAILAAVCLVAGPLAATVVRAFSPATKQTESVVRLIADAAAHPARTQVVLVANSFVWLMVPAALIAISLAWRRAPALSLAAAVFSVAGWVAIVSPAMQDALIAQAGHHGYDHAQAVALTDVWSNSGAVNVYTTLFVVGHLVGTILLGAALWRARAIPRWAAAAIGVSMPLHLVAFLSSVTALDIAAYALLLAGFGACAVRVLREAAPVPLQASVGIA